MPVPGYPTATHYSPNFSRRELDCRCGCTTPQGVAMNLAELARSLEAMRGKAGAPLGISSGYRCPQHNRRVGGVEGSQHTQGIAADVTSKTLSPARLKRAAEAVPAFADGGIGTYKTWVHVDTRKGGPARWQG